MSRATDLSTCCECRRDLPEIQISAWPICGECFDQVYGHIVRQGDGDENEEGAA